MILRVAVVLLAGCLAGCSPPGAHGGAASVAGGDVAERNFGGIVRASRCYADEAEKGLREALASLTGPRQPRRAGVLAMQCMNLMLPAYAQGPTLPPPPLIPPPPLPLTKVDLGQLLARARATHATLTVQVDPQNANVTVQTSDVRSTAMLVSELSERLTPVGEALRASTTASATARTFALQAVFTASYSERHRGPMTAADAKDSVVALLTAAARADRVQASATALLAQVQAAVAGQADPAKVLAMASDLAGALGKPADVPASAVEAEWRVGEAKAEQLEAQIDAARSSVQSAPPPSPGGGQLDLGTVADDASDVKSDVGDAVSGVVALMHGDVAGVLKGASILFPKDSPIRHGMRAVSAVMHGDFRSALSEATHLVPADSDVGRVLGAANAVLAVVH